MKLTIYNTKPHDEEGLKTANQGRHDLQFMKVRLNPRTARIPRAVEAVCAFVNDDVGAETLEALAERGCRIVALRCAGYNNVDLEKARELGIAVANVPAYSPHAVAEFAVGLILTLNRKYHRAYTRTRDGNFTLLGLRGFDMHGKTVGVIGTGKIGGIFCQLMLGFGCRVLAHDVYQDKALVDAGVQYVELDQLFRESRVISLHCPLIPATQDIINAESLAKMQDGVMLINTSRGGLVDTQAVLEGLKSKKVSALGLDVYDEEAALFYEDFSEEIVLDDLLMRLTTFPNVVVTSHQAFFTEEALKNIADTTIGNVSQFEETGTCDHAVKPTAQ